MCNKGTFAVVWCLVFLAAGCSKFTVDLNNRPCETEEGGCLSDQGYECDFASFTCKQCVGEAQFISCSAGSGFRICDGQGNWSDCALQTSDGGPSGGDNVTPGDSDLGGDNVNPGDSDLGGDNVNPGDSDLGGDNVIPGDSELGGDNVIPGDSELGGDNVIPGDSELGGDSFIDPCIPDPCNGNGSCNSSDGSCICFGDWVGDWCTLEVVVVTSGYTSLQNGLHTVYKFSMKSIQSTVIRGQYFTFAFRDQSGGVSTTIQINSAILYEDSIVLLNWATTITDTTFWEYDVSNLITLTSGVVKNYELVLQIGNYTAGDRLTTALTLVTLQDSTEIIVTGKEFTLP